MIILDILRGTGGGLRPSKRTTNLRTVESSHFGLCASSRVSQAKCQTDKVRYLYVDFKTILDVIRRYNRPTDQTAYKKVA